MHDAADYYRQRKLVPPAYAPLLTGLNANIAITNFHAFEPRLIGGNKKSPLDGKLGADGRKVEAREDESLMLRRVLSGFKPGRRILVLNDEAHHCYLPRAKGRDSEEEMAATENERAAVWYQRLARCCAALATARGLRPVGHAVLPGGQRLAGLQLLPVGGERLRAD
jgi:type III restriction enzyme